MITTVYYFIYGDFLTILYIAKWESWFHLFHSRRWFYHALFYTWRRTKYTAAMHAIILQTYSFVIRLIFTVNYSWYFEWHPILLSVMTFNLTLWLFSPFWNLYIQNSVLCMSFWIPYPMENLGYVTVCNITYLCVLHC